MNRHNEGWITGAIRAPGDVRSMFDRIVPHYDLMNRIMTGGRDVAWRKIAVREALTGQVPGEMRVLDVATGTGDLAIALKTAGAGDVVGLDFSKAMLVEAQRKAAERLDAPLSWIEGDALALPFANETFDAVTVGFGLRNMRDYNRALAEMSRVLRPGAALVCLETTPLASQPLRSIFERASRAILPWLGGILSGDPDAYAYLPASAALFPDAEELGRMMQRCGLEQVRFLRLGFGTIALHVGLRKRELVDLVTGNCGVPSPGQRQSLDESHGGEQTNAHQ